MKKKKIDMYKFWSKYSGVIKTDLNISQIDYIPYNEDNKELILTLMSCLRSGHTPTFNGDTLSNFRNLAVNTIIKNN